MTTTNIEGLKAAFAQQFINREHVPFLKTGNPAHAWAAYRIARAFGVPTPEWVLVYFDGCAAKLADATNDELTAEAIGFDQKGGGASKVAQARTNTRNFDILARFIDMKYRQTSSELKSELKTAGFSPKRIEELLEDVIDEQGGDTALYAQLGEEFGLAGTTVGDIIREFIPTLRELLRTTKA